MATRSVPSPIRLLALLAPLLAGCAALSGVSVDPADTGELVVRVKSPRSFEDLADDVYGERALGPEIAEISGLPFEEGVPGGSLLVLPPRSGFQKRLDRARSVETLFAQGLDAADGGSYRTAADRFREALEISPQRIDIRYNLGLALFRSGSLPEAARVLEEVAEHRPEDAETRYALGSVLRKQRAFERALEEFEAARRLDRDHAGAAFAWARTLEDLGETSKAERAWRRFLREFPDHELAPSARQRLEQLELTPETVESGVSPP